MNLSDIFHEYLDPTPEEYKELIQKCKMQLEEQHDEEDKKVFTIPYYLHNILIQEDGYLILKAYTHSEGDLSYHFDLVAVRDSEKESQYADCYMVKHSVQMSGKHILSSKYQLTGELNIAIKAYERMIKETLSKLNLDKNTLLQEDTDTQEDTNSQA